MAGCHASGGTYVDLEADGVASRLIGKQAMCGGENRVFITTDGSPSFLLQKVQDSPPCGSKMPIGRTLTATELTCMTSWVDSVSGGGN